MRVRFNRYLRPSSVVRQSVLVTPGLFDADTGAPKGPVVFFEPVYDPYERMVVFLLAPGARWIPTTLHSVTLAVPEDDGDITGFRAFDGEPLDEELTYGFITSDRVSDPEHDIDDARPRVRFCASDEAPTDLPAAFDVLEGNCARSGCHGGGDATLGLDLSRSARVRDTAIRVVARETLTGATVGAPVANARRFGENMPLVDPGSPGNSYLVYKLLVKPGNHPPAGDVAGEPDPWLGGLPPPGAPALDELTRLRRAFVVGDPMPIDANLRPEEMRAIVRWIAQGAETPECDP